MLGFFCQNWIFGQIFDFSNGVYCVTSIAQVQHFLYFSISDPGVNGYSGYSGAAAPVQSGFVDPNRPNQVYIPPSNEQPPSYDESVSKKNN